MPVIVNRWFYTPGERNSGGVYRNHLVCLSLCLCSLHVCPITFFIFDIGIPYLTMYGSITIRECVAFIQDPDMMLTFDLKVKFIEFLT